MMALFLVFLILDDPLPPSSAHAWDEADEADDDPASPGPILSLRPRSDESDESCRLLLPLLLLLLLGAEPPPGGAGCGFEDEPPLGEAGWGFEDESPLGGAGI